MLGITGTSFSLHKHFVRGQIRGSLYLSYLLILITNHLLTRIWWTLVPRAPSLVSFKRPTTHPSNIKLPLSSKPHALYVCWHPEQPPIFFFLNFSCAHWNYHLVQVTTILLKHKLLIPTFSCFFHCISYPSLQPTLPSATHLSGFLSLAIGSSKTQRYFTRNPL